MLINNEQRSVHSIEHRLQPITLKGKLALGYALQFIEQLAHLSR